MLIIPVKEIETEFDYGIGHEEDSVKDDNCACHHPGVCKVRQIKLNSKTKNRSKQFLYREFINEQVCEYDPRGSLSISNNGRERCE